MQISKLTDLSLLLKEKKINIIVGKINSDIPKTEAQIVVSPGIVDKKALANIAGVPFLIHWPGEYEISDISIFGLKSLYIINVEELRFGYLDNPKASFTEDEIEEIDGLDVLICSLNSEEVDIKTVSHTVGQIQPKIVIPLGSPEATKMFLKAIGQEEARQEKKLNIIQANLPEETEAIILQDKNG